MDRPVTNTVLSVEAPSWDLVRAFLALYRKGDYQAAAESLGVDGSTLRRRIRALEQAIGSPVFVRDKGVWALAPGKEAMVEAALAMEMGAEPFFRAGEAEAGTVRLSMPGFCYEWLLPHLARFQQAHPHLRLAAAGEARFVDLEREGVDFAIRLARPVRHMSNLRIKKLGDMGLGIYTAESYQRAHAPDGPHAIIGTTIDFAHRDHEFSYGAVDWEALGIQGEVVASLDDLGACARLCAEGLGVALLPHFIARTHPTLRLMDDRGGALNSELWLVSRLDMREPWQRDFIDVIGEAWRVILG